MLLEGIQLTLMIGPAVPLPAPRAVVEALTEVEVRVPTDGPTVFELRFGLARRSPLTTLFLLSGGNAVPLLRVVLVATLGGRPQVLVDGVVTETEVAPAGEGNLSTLTVRGEDLTRVMDYFELDGLPYPAMPPEVRVLAALAKYAAFGVAPLVVPPILPDVPIPIDRIPIHQGTDLQYIRELACDAGYTFYLEPGPLPGASVAYWGPRVKVGVPQPALNTDMDAATNVESLSFTLDTQRSKLPVIFIHDKLTKVSIPIPVPDVSPLSPPLGLVPPLPKGIELLKSTAKESPVRAAALGLARAAENNEVVRGNGRLDVLRYGRLLAARRLVGVRGAGEAFDGLYYVDSVSHSIRRGEYKQGFTLSRNGLLSTVPRVAA